MLNKLTQKKMLILIAYAAVYLVLWTLALIFGNREDKLTVLILSLVLPFVVYGFMRLIYKIMDKSAPNNAMLIFQYFFTIAGLLGTVFMLVEFIGNFPNGMSPSIGVCGALIVATLDSAK